MNAPARNSATRDGSHVHAADLHGVGRLLLLAVGVVIDRTETLHMKLTGATLPPGHGSGIGGFAYRRARALIAMAGHLVDAALDQENQDQPAPLSSSEREAVLAALNGLFGDLLARLDNPLAIPMRLRQRGHALRIEQAMLAQQVEAPRGKLLILVHGLCRSDLQWCRGKHDHGASLARDLGYSPLYLHYNSGRHVSTNGRELADLLEQLVAQWPVPVEEVAIVGHSMGGLVARSACHYGRAAHHAWLGRLAHMVFIGTPHHGAPLERHGNWLGVVLGRNTLTAPLARLGELRSAGITDLRYGNLLDEDWFGHDRFAQQGDMRRHVPLPRAVKCYAIAGSTGRRSGDIRHRLLGDGLIPVDTALGWHPEPARRLAFPASRQWVAFGIHHLDLLGRVEVYEKIHAWLARPRP